MAAENRRMLAGMECARAQMGCGIDGSEQRQNDTLIQGRRWLLSVGMGLGLLATSGLLQAQTATLVPGSTAGEFSVSPSGAATYSVPIAVPPGVAGVAPQVSLSYSSQGGNGMMGIGWDLDAASAITRCPRTTATDDFFGSVNLDSGDRFCLDGQRLINVSGSYGAAGSVYRSEIDNFNRVTANGAAAGSAANGPESFTVHAKDGTVLYYGATADSRIEAQGRTVVAAWLLNRMQDANGNAIDYLYDEDNASGHWRLRSISYANRSVQFSYETRPDVVPSYLAGSLMSTPVRLSRVETRVGQNVVMRTNITYSAASSVRGSLVQSIQQCDATNKCLAPLELQWSDVGTPAFANSTWTGPSTYLNVMAADMNGDGRTDLLRYVSGTTWQVCMSNGTGSFSCGNWTGTEGLPSDTATAVADFDGAGRTGIARYTGADGRWIVCKSSGTKFNCYNWSTGYNNWNQYTKTGDFDGDGRADLINHISGSSWRICLTRASFSCFNTSAHSGAGENVFVGDFNGDGRDDLAGYTSAGNWHVCLSVGGNFNCSTWAGHNGGASNNVVADFNGDGLSDMARYTTDGNWNVCLSTGSGFQCGVWAGHNGGTSNNLIADFNGDGLSDMARSATSGDWTVCLSTGVGFECSTWGGMSGNTTDNHVGDFYGEGRSQLTRRTGSSNWRVAQPQVQGVRRALAFNLGPVQSVVEYGNLIDPANPDLYTRDTDAVFPRLDVRAPMWVVSRSGQSNGLGGLNHSNYRYGGLKSEYAWNNGRGRGNLGFRWRLVSEEATGISSYTEYAQDWPFIGQTILSETRLSGKGSGGVLKRTEVTQGCYQTGVQVGGTQPAAATTACGSWAAGKIYFPFTSGVSESSWDLEGAVMPVIETANSYAGTPETGGAVRQWGLATQVRADVLQGGQLRHRKTTVNEYHPTDASNWRLGRLKKATVTSTQY